MYMTKAMTKVTISYDDEGDDESDVTVFNILSWYFESAYFTILDL